MLLADLADRRDLGAGETAPVGLGVFISSTRVRGVIACAKLRRSSESRRRARRGWAGNAARAAITPS